MLRREQIVRELEKRLWAMKKAQGFSFDVALVARNPIEEPTVFPAVHLFEMDDDVKDSTRRGKTAWPVDYARSIQLVVEFWLQPSSEAASSTEVVAMYEEVRNAVMAGGGTLAGLCRAIDEVKASRIIKPVFKAGNVAGMGITLNATYAETLNS